MRAVTIVDKIVPHLGTAEPPVAADEALFGKLRRVARCSSLREAASQGHALASPLNQTLGRRLRRAAPAGSLVGGERHSKGIVGGIG